PCTKASHVAHMNAADNTPRSSLPSCSHCLDVIWQTKRLFIQSRNKTQHPPFTLRLAENFSPQIKEGITANMAEIPTLIPILLWGSIVSRVGTLREVQGSECVCVLEMSVLSETHISIPARLVADSSSCHPQAQRLGCLLIYGCSRIRWRCCPMCQPGSPKSLQELSSVDSSREGLLEVRFSELRVWCLSKECPDGLWFQRFITGSAQTHTDSTYMPDGWLWIDLGHVPASGTAITGKR
ncbi:hypothetical protein KUCAC02_008979, partial [Chaenocephalus aceratus]